MSARRRACGRAPRRRRFRGSNARRPFRIEVGDLHSLQEALQIMELRTGVEIEAAGLGGGAGPGRAIRKIKQAYDMIERAIERGETAVDEDFAFHCSIADATGNSQFRRFLEYLGRFIIPRQSIRRSLPRMEDQRAYLKRIQKEHLDISIPFAPARRWRPGPRCGAISSTASGAIRS